MCDTTMAPLAQLAADLEAHRRPDVRVLPDEFRQRLPIQVDDGARQKRPNESQPNPPRMASQFCNPAADSLAVNLSSMLALAKPRTSKILKISVLLPTEGGIERIIRPEFFGMCVPCRKPPCWCHHIYRACRDGNSCCWAHAFWGRLSPQMIEGIAHCMQQHLDDIIAQHPK
jgi:hypothetical protein